MKDIRSYAASGSTPLDQLLARDILREASPPKDAVAPPAALKERRRKMTALTDNEADGAATQGSSKRVAVPFALLPPHLKELLPPLEKRLPGSSLTTVPNILRKESTSNRGGEVYYAVQFKLTLDDDSSGPVERVYAGMTPARERLARKMASEGKSHREIFSALRERVKNGEGVQRDLSASPVTITAQSGSGTRKKITFKLPGTFTHVDTAGVARQIAMNKISQLGERPQRAQIHACIANVHNEIIAAARSAAAKSAKRQRCQ